MGFFRAIGDFISSIFGGGESSESGADANIGPDPVGDSFRDVDTGPDVASTDPGDYDSFSLFASETGTMSAQINIGAGGVDVEFFDAAGNSVGSSHHDRISDFFDTQYDDLEGEGIEIEIQDEYAKA